MISKNTNLVPKCRVTMLAAVSADGFLARSAAESSTAWTSQADKAFFRQQTRLSGWLVMGKRTFQTIGRPLSGRNIIVLTSQPGKFMADWSFAAELPTSQMEIDHSPSGEVFVSDYSPTELITWCQQQGLAELIVAGGQQVYQQFLAAGHLNHIWLTVEPVEFGSAGLYPIRQQIFDLGWRLVSTEELNETGTKILHFLPPNILT